MKRTFAIGDIHGGFRALQQLLGRINPQDDDTFIFLGDYVDGWSESAQVIDFLIEFDTIYHCIFIKGNHDVWVADWLKTGFVQTYHKSGAEATIESYKKHSLKAKWQHADFFQKMKLHYLDEQQRLFLHAGFTSIHGIEDEPDENVFYNDRTLWETVVEMDKKLDPESPFYPYRLTHYKEIYVGHNPTIWLGDDFHTPTNFANLWNIDTGAAFTGKLSAINVDTKEVFQSEEVWGLYPDEKGRN
jgi:serine/threonine protein phosphatase 1